MGLVDGLGHLAEEQKTGKKTCPLCHATWEKLEKRQRLGCPSCWKTFAAEIREHVLDGDYGLKHVGAMPPNTVGNDMRAFLQRELKTAIRLQDYEKASVIQRQLDALDGKDGK